MQFRRQPRSWYFQTFLLLGLLLGTEPCALRAQSGAGTGYETRGDGGEIDVTVHDSTGNLISTPATVKIELNGAPFDQGVTSKGRIFFLLHKMGDFQVIVEATGFKTGKKDVQMDIPIKTEVDITLRPETTTTPAVGAAGDPVLAPKAKESLDTAIHDLREGDLSGADKAIGEAMKLAPNHPDVLYVQGMLDLQRHEWAKAQGVLEKSAQIEPNHARTQAALGMALCNQKKYQEAIAPLEKSVQLDPNSGWETNWSLAQAYYTQKDTTKRQGGRAGRDRFSRGMLRRSICCWHKRWSRSGDLKSQRRCCAESSKITAVRRKQPPPSVSSTGCRPTARSKSSKNCSGAGTFYDASGPSSTVNTSLKKWLLVLLGLASGD